MYYYFVIAWLLYLILGGNAQIILVSAHIPDFVIAPPYIGRRKVTNNSVFVSYD